MGFWAAVQFLTIFPVPLRRKIDDREIGASLTYFPLVGLGIGVILIGLDWGIKFLLPFPVVNALLVAALVIITGAHHLDGFIDSCDGVISGRTPEERLAIMRDSRTGAFGVIGAVLLLLVKYAALISIPGKLRTPALWLMPPLARWSMVGTIFFFPYVRNSGMGLAFKQGANKFRLIIATAITLAASLVLLKGLGVMVMLALGLITLSIAKYFYSRLGGLTGDAYGAINEIAEVAILILLILFSQWL